MSDLMAVLVVGSSVLHCVDFDRPYWYRRDNAEDGIVPGPETFVVDALLALAHEELGLDALARVDAGLQGHVFPAKGSSEPFLDAARTKAYAADRPGLLYVAVGHPEGFIVQDLERFSMPTYTALTTHASVEGLRP